MTISRRWFMAGMALTGAALPAAFYAHRELTREEFPITPGEATVDLADTAGQQLADSLRGVWDIRFTGAAAGLDGLPNEGLELFLDIAHRGRGLRGYLDTGGLTCVPRRQCVIKSSAIWRRVMAPRCSGV